MNEGFSGGEKKRNEIFQMAILDPALAILDETDSGLDIDALRVVAGGVNQLRAPERAMIMVTHYQRLLDYIVPDFVHVLLDGQDRALGRQGAGAGAGGEGLRVAGAGAGRSGARRAWRAAEADVYREALRALPREACRARRPGCASCARRPSRASRELGFPTHARGGVAVHRASRRSRAPPSPRPRRSRWRRAELARLAELGFADALDGPRVVFVNGRFAPELSSLPEPPGLSLRQPARGAARASRSG